MNFEQARYNMIEQQIRTWEVLDQNVLDLLMKIHREDFVPDAFRQLALADTRIPLAHGQVTMTPKVEARILQSVDIQKTDKVLEIGTGCAYLTAVIANMAKEVISIDIFPEFTKSAEEKLQKHGITNVTLETGDAISGFQPASPYDVIIVTGSLPVPDDCFQNQLAINGRLFVITGHSPVMDATLITRAGENEWAKEILFETDIPPLVGAKEPKKFQF